LSNPAIVLGKLGIAPQEELEIYYVLEMLYESENGP
jgi:hypothetical protein